jgi:hypothetical protein
MIGVLLFAAGLRIGAGAVAPGLRGLARTMLLARGLRLAILGLCAVAVALGAVFGSSATVGVALVIAAEELLEITTVVAALRWGEEHGL